MNLRQYIYKLEGNWYNPPSLRHYGRSLITRARAYYLVHIALFITCW